LRIEKTSIHDGTGLRTVVFLKGCPLRCLWCSTPESQSGRLEIGYGAERCTLCGRCIEICPQKALSFDDRRQRIVIDRERCDGCFACVRKCPAQALKSYGSMMTVDEVIGEIEKDAVFYFHSGGGVTISGGEPLDQAEFVGALLRECRNHGIHRALETSFFGRWETIEPLLPLLDLVHTDLKHPFADEHRRLTGVDNGLIRENIVKADGSKHPFDLVVRIPLIPGINDSDEALRGSAEFVKGLHKLKEVEFLAYHRLGIDTYDHLGWSYPLKEIKTPDGEFMLSRARFFLAQAPQVAVKINGAPVVPD
jgi:pyruvate formate lyase activating enzyme